MSRRLSYEYVREFFESHSCELLESKYIDNSTKMKFNCSCGRVGSKTYQGFSKVPRCDECGRENSLKQLKPRKKFTYEIVKSFIEDNSDCKLESKSYKNNSERLEIRCGCGDVFFTGFAKFKDRNKRQCNDCSKDKVRKHNAHSYEDVKRFIEVESESGCKLISKTYINNATPLKMKCKCGEDFEVTFNKFNSRGRKQRHCEKCSSIIRNEIHSFSIEKVDEIVNSHDCKLISETYVNARSPIEVECGCGENFVVTLEVFQRGKTRCNICSGKQSRLEATVENYLKQNDVDYRTEYTFEECRSIEPLPFDFAAMDEDTVKFLIEVDGEQHYHPVEIFGGEEAFIAQKERDKIKDTFCDSQKIKLIRIPYYKIDSLDELIKIHL